MDRRLRQLERDYRRTSTLDAEVAWLGERVRQGLLPIEHLELAAALLHPAARRVLGGEDSLVRWTETVGVWNLERWLRKLSAWGLLPVARAAIAAGRFVLEPGEAPAVRRVLVAAERWVLQPRSAQLQKVAQAARELRALSAHDARAFKLTSMASALAEALETRAAPIAPIVQATRLVDDPVALRLAICDEVSSWALGYGDPVAERVDPGRASSA